MTKNPKTGIFEILLRLPKGIHQFKFIVDNQWKCSKFYKIITDKMNNDNNIIDLTNDIPQNVIENNANNHQKKRKKPGKEQIDYNCDFPNLADVNSEAPAMPIHFIPPFYLNYLTNQNLISLYEKKIYLHLNKSKKTLENDCFKSIITISNRTNNSINTKLSIKNLFKIVKLG